MEVVVTSLPRVGMISTAVRVAQVGAYLLVSCCRTAKRDNDQNSRGSDRPGALQALDTRAPRDASLRSRDVM